MRPPQVKGTSNVCLKKQKTDQFSPQQRGKNTWMLLIFEKQANAGFCFASNFNFYFLKPFWIHIM